MRLRRSTRLAGLLLEWENVETVDASDSDSTEPSTTAKRRRVGSGLSFHPGERREVQTASKPSAQGSIKELHAELGAQSSADDRQPTAHKRLQMSTNMNRPCIAMESGRMSCRQAQRVARRADHPAER